MPVPRAAGNGARVKPAEIRERLAKENPEALLADGLDDALIGIGRRASRHLLAVYDYETAVNVFVTRDGMSREEAIEHMEFDVVGAWVGENTPVFLQS
ncbi:MAG: hypothetical protein ACE5F6_00375 [Anaerolineae bacterium]